MDYQGMTASAVLYFNEKGDEKGEMTNFIAKRYREVKGHYYLEEWSPLMLEYREINGIKIPTKLEVVWKLSSGDFPCIKIEVTDIMYNNLSIY